MKDLKNMNFNELTNEAASHIMAGLIEGGGKEFKSQVFMWMEMAIRWNAEQRKIKQKKAK